MTEKRKNIRLILLDIDGTIVDTPHRYTVTEEFCETVREVERTGVLVGLASGRNYGHIMSQMRSIGFHGPFVCNDGAYIVMNGQMQSESLLRKTVLEQVWRQMKELGCYVEFSGRDVMHTCKMPLYTGATFPQVGTDPYLDIMEVCDDAFAQMTQDHISKVTILVDQREKANAVTEYWTCGPLAGQVSLTRSFWFALELTNPGISKGSGLLAAAHALQIPLENVMVLGDGDNDVELLQSAGVSFAMANASEAAQRAAKYKAPSVSEDGATQVLRRCVLEGCTPEIFQE